MIILARDCMKKVLLYIIICFCLIDVNAQDRVTVQLDKCVDGDTAWFIFQGKREKFRFLAINTPESTNKIEEYGKESSKYTCDALTNAKKLEIEFDPKSDEKDKYNRYLAWIFVDNELLQKKLIENGYAEIKYIYGDYLYLDELKEVEENVKKKKIGIFKEQENNLDFHDYIVIGIGGVIFILMMIIFPKYRKKVTRKAKNYTKKQFKKSIKKIH